MGNLGQKIFVNILKKSKAIDSDHLHCIALQWNCTSHIFSVYQQMQRLSNKLVYQFGKTHTISIPEPKEEQWL